MEEQFVTFVLGDERFAVGIMNIVEVIRKEDITDIPKALDFVEGIINLRGNVIPVIAMRKRFKTPGEYTGGDQKILVARIGEKSIGFMVDAVEEVIRIKSDDVHEAETGNTTIDNSFVEGIADTEKGLIIVIDISRILNKYEQQKLSSL